VALEESLLPFPRENFDKARQGESVLRMEHLSPLLREVAEANTHVWEYLQALPIEEIGVPTYYPKLTRKMKKMRIRNLIYPTADETVFIHIYPDTKSERDYYIPIEPVLPVTLNGTVAKVESKLLEYAEEIGKAPEEERGEAFTSTLDKICTTSAAVRGPGKIVVDDRELVALKYVTIRNKMGLGVLQPLLADPYIEDISCSGVGRMFVEHKIFKSLKSSVNFQSHEDLDDFVVQMGERIKRPVTLRNPIVDATLPDGSRINIVYGRDIARRGSNFTIRKFAEDTISVLDLIEFGSMNYLIAAYMWLAMEEDMNVFVVGPTASGKTTLINALTTFIRPDAKIVTIEDTPELKVPHHNWVREVVRNMAKGEKGSGVDMFDLLRAALRQRPDLIMIGEIRGAEGNIAFQAMQTGHPVMATFHASSVEKVIQRLTGDPINVPKVNIDNLDLVIIQAAVRAPDGSTVRRVTSVNEIVSYDSVSNTFSFVTAFRWKSDTDTFEFPGDMNSFLLEQKIAIKRGYAEDKVRGIYTELRKRAAILEKLHKRGGVNGFDKLFAIIAEAYKQGLV
jgi:flagellar protein FlaI